ncbi:MAG: toxin-antitoxin system HicB family antitoxin [Candidatus Omnitrophota bacterium]
MNRDLNYYMSLPYKIEIEPLREEDGGGFEAFIPQLGRMTMTAAGDTEEEAIQILREVKETLFSHWIEEGFPIPEPEEESPYNGRILVRTTKELHRELAIEAKKQGVSLNAFINQSLLLGYTFQSFKMNLEKICSHWSAGSASQFKIELNIGVSDFSSLESLPPENKLHLVA